MSNGTCRWPECDRTDILARGLCDRCYRRARRAGKLEQFEVTIRSCDICGDDFVAGKHGRLYCSEPCRETGYRHGLQARVEERRERKRGKKCAQCSAPIPEDVRADSRHCSVACQQAAWYYEKADELLPKMKEWRDANPEARAESARLRNARISSTSVETIRRADVLAESDGICPICHERIDMKLETPNPLSPSIDHIVPLAKGGPHVRENLHVTHLRCNLRKGLKDLSKVVMSE